MTTLQTSTRPRLLIVEDDPDIRDQMKWALGTEYDIAEADDRATAIELCQNLQPTIVSLDLGLPPDVDDVIQGLQTLEEILTLEPLTKVIVVTGDSERAHALKAIRMGAYDYVHKPVELDTLRIILGRAAYLVHLERENRALSQQMAQEPYEDMLGTSSAMQKVFETIRRVGASDIPVLILGESGTGKELVARALHRQKHESTSPFVAINCSAIPETLLETELFGHEKGAFTGAHIQRKGRVEASAGGTLFLDEIGEIPQALQAKLLRFLQEHEIERVGGRDSVKVETRVIAATNVDLEKATEAGRFREDLYYRLRGVCIKLPPLRDRGRDIEVLAMALLNRYAVGAKKRVVGFTKQALRAMEAHRWPGNIRELENRLRRAVVMAEGRMITPDDLELDSSVRYHGVTLKTAREALEREIIGAAITRHEGNMTRVAQELGITRPTLYDLMAKLKIGGLPKTSLMS